ncbi:hypothetical protein [Maricaulis sp. CAU 1757]
MIKQGVAVIVAAVLAGCSGQDGGETPPAASIERIEGVGVTAQLAQLENGGFSLDYVFDQPQALVIFSRSSADHRRGAWQPLDAGVTLERIGGFDALVFDTPRMAASLSVEPVLVQPDGDYSPFVGFSDGGLAVFTGQFEVLPVESRAEIEGLDGDLANWQGEQPWLGVRILSDRRIVHEGAVQSDAVTVTSRGSGSFVYLGEGDIEVGESYVGVIDSALPEWMRESLDTDFQSIFETYVAEWGSGLSEPTVLYFAYSGDDHPGFSNSGGVAGRDIMMEASGEALRQPHPQIRNYVRWFFAHEIAHQFQADAGPMPDRMAESWLHEGTANAMANALVAGMSQDAPAYLAGEYAVSWAGCTDALAGGALTGAGARGRFEAYYDCGALIALMSDAAAPEADLYGLWKAAGARAAGADDGFTGPVWFDTLAAHGATPEAVAALRALVEDELDDPQAALLAAMDLAGVSVEFDAQGQLIRIQGPEET